MSELSKRNADRHGAFRQPAHQPSHDPVGASPDLEAFVVASTGGRAKRAERDGLRSSASFPIRVNGTVGALNLYAKSEHAFDNGTSDIAEVFAKQAAIALENAAIYGAARKLGDKLNEALRSRDLIGQAKGILMEREGVSDEEAFSMLKTISQNSNIRLRDVAERLAHQPLKAAKLK